MSEFSGTKYKTYGSSGGSGGAGNNNDTGSNTNDAGGSISSKNPYKNIKNNP